MEDIRFDGGIGLKINNVGFINVKREKNYFFEFPDGKESFTFVFVQKGEMKYDFFTTNEIIRLAEGEMLYIPRRIPYKTEYTESATTIKTLTFIIDGDHLPSYIPKVPVKKNSKEYTSVFDAITNINMRNTIFLAAKTYELLYLLQSKRHLYTKTQRKILPALNEIYEKYNEKRPLSYYAGMCNMSESNFRKIFKECTGKSPIEFRNMLRIEEAKS